LEKLHQLFVKSPDTGKRTFLEKFTDQLAKADQGTLRLAAEVVLVHFLFPSSIGGDTKRGLVRTVLSWAKETVPDAHPAMAALSRGIGSGGQGYNTRRPNEITFVINVVLALEKLPAEAQTAAFAGPWALRDAVDLVEGAESSQFRHMLLHLLFPDEFERISSGSQKGQIDRAFHDLAGEEK